MDWRDIFMAFLGAAIMGAKRLDAAETKQYIVGMPAIRKKHGA